MRRATDLQSLLRLSEGVTMSTSSDHEQLVALVKQRTEELQRINQQLQREINEHRLVEQALRINEEKFRDIFNSIQDIFFRMTLNGTFTL